MDIRRFAWVLLACCALLSMACVLFLPPRGPITFTPQVLPEAQVGAAYEAKVTVSGNATPVINFVVQEGALPPGLELVRVEGEDTVRITGAPSQAGTFAFRLFLYCYGTNVPGQQAEKEYQILVK